MDVLLLFHKGFGYIEFSRITNYDEAKIIGTHHIKGRSLEVKKAKPKGAPSSGGPHHVSLLFSKNLSCRSIAINLHDGDS